MKRAIIVTYQTGKGPRAYWKASFGNGIKMKRAVDHSLSIEENVIAAARDLASRNEWIVKSAEIVQNLDVYVVVIES